jgi:hypothetical protein
MWMNKFGKYLLAGLALGGALFAWRDWKVSDPHTPEIADIEDYSRSPTPVRQVSVASKSSETALTARSRMPQPPSRLPLQPHDFPADDYPKGWDELGSAERMEHLEARFGDALAALEAGEQPVAKHAFVAESALTSMRAELYGTASGRAQHQRQETRLDHALGEAVPGNEGAPK